MRKLPILTFALVALFCFNACDETNENSATPNDNLGSRPNSLLGDSEADFTDGSGLNCPAGYITDQKCDSEESECLEGTLGKLCRKVPEDVTESEYLPVTPTQRCTTKQLELSPETLRVHIIDVGQGDAIWIQTPTNQNILVDAGDAGFYGKTAGAPIINDYMELHGFPEGAVLDAMVLTHPDSDHYGGFPKVLKAHPTRNYIDPGKESSKLYNNWMSQLKKTDAIIYQPAEEFWAAGDLMPEDIFGSEIEATYIYSDASAKDNNSSSIIFKLTYAERSFLLTGDATKAAEKAAVLAGGEHLSANFLKVCHHGSDTSSTVEFLDAVLEENEPEERAAFISSGRKKFSGSTIPRIEIIERLKSYIYTENIFSTAAGDDLKDEEDAIRDDNILLVIHPDGSYYACYSGTN